jgi:hypothetical protein
MRIEYHFWSDLPPKLGHAESRARLSTFPDFLIDQPLWAG